MWQVHSWDASESPLKIWEKRDRGHIQGVQDCPDFFGYPILSQEQVKLRTLNYVHTFIGSITTKSHEKIGKSIAVGIVRESRKIFRAPIYGAHCADIFAIAQLSCYLSFYIYIYIIP